MNWIYVVIFSYFYSYSSYDFFAISLATLFLILGVVGPLFHMMQKSRRPMFRPMRRDWQWDSNCPNTKGPFFGFFSFPVMGEIFRFVSWMIIDDEFCVWSRNTESLRLDQIHGFSDPWVGCTNERALNHFHGLNRSILDSLNSVFTVSDFAYMIAFFFNFYSYFVFILFFFFSLVQQTSGRFTDFFLYFYVFKYSKKG